MRSALLKYSKLKKVMVTKNLLHKVIILGALVGISTGITSSDGKYTNKARKKFQPRIQNTAFNTVNSNQPLCKTTINCQFSTNSGECLCLAKKREKPEELELTTI